MANLRWMSRAMFPGCCPDFPAVLSVAVGPRILHPWNLNSLATTSKHSCAFLKELSSDTPTRSIQIPTWRTVLATRNFETKSGHQFLPQGSPKPAPCNRYAVSGDVLEVCILAVLDEDAPARESQQTCQTNIGNSSRKGVISFFHLLKARVLIATLRLISPWTTDVGCIFGHHSPVPSQNRDLHSTPAASISDCQSKSYVEKISATLMKIISVSVMFFSGAIV